MGKRNYVRPFATEELFTPNEYCSNCTESASDSSDGKFIYGWVLMCETATYNGTTYGHKHNECPDQSTYYKVDDQGNITGETVEGTFIRAINQSGGSNFSLDNAVGGTKFLIDDDNNGEDPGDYWVVDGHAFKVGGEYTISYPYSHKFNVNLS